MKNHVHLLVETRDTPLSKILQGINQTYTLYFNRKYKTVGHLFQGRYKAILCDKDKYLLTLLKYIHENPLRSKTVKDLSAHLWSSHHAYMGKADECDLIDVDQVLRMFSEKKAQARQLYNVYMGKQVYGVKEAIYSTVDQRLLGDEDFVEHVVEKGVSELKKEKRKTEYSLQAIAKAAETVFGVSLRELRGKNKDSNIMKVKKIFCLVALEYGHRGREIAGYIEKDPAIVTRYGKEKLWYRAEIDFAIKTLNEEKVNSQV
jgi:hypothetical protein